MAIEQKPVTITFAGGINTRQRIADIMADECTDGQNFELSREQRALIARKPFDLVATAPNLSQINGYAQLVTRAGAVTTLIQAGTGVYSWDGASAFTLVGTVSGSAELRGPLEQNFTLDDIVIITDLNKAQPVMQWNGTTFSTFTHNLGGSLYAKFARVVGERLLLANVTAATAVPHLLVGSELSNANVLTVSNRPSSALSDADPFYLPMPDLKPINGMEEVAQQLVLSTARGKLFALSGSSAFDFNITPFYQGSSISNDDAMVNTGNDLLLGVEGRIETLSGIVGFGDVETNDLTRFISTEVDEVTGWRMVYDRRNQRVMCFPDDGTVCWVFYKGLLYYGSQKQLNTDTSSLSPWSKWTTNHVMEMRPTTVMRLIDPASMIEYVYMGDRFGNIYRFDGAGDRDGALNAVTVKRRSGLIMAPDADIFDVRVNIDYRKNIAADVVLRFLFAGVETADATLTVSIPSGGSAFYGGSFYYGGVYYYSSQAGKIRRTQKHAQGRGNGLQIEVEISAQGVVDIQQIEIILNAAKG